MRDGPEPEVDNVRRDLRAAQRRVQPNARAAPWCHFSARRLYKESLWAALPFFPTPVSLVGRNAIGRLIILPHPVLVCMAPPYGKQRAAARRAE